MPIKVEGVSSQRTSGGMGFGQVSRSTAADTSFSMELANHDQNMSREDMERLLAEIDRQGARLSRTPTYDELSEYRTLVQNFVNAAVSRMYSMHTDAGWDRFGRQKVYTTVKNIDRELEDMAERIRLGQADQLSIVASQDAIRGMLVDLYM